MDFDRKLDLFMRVITEQKISAEDARSFVNNIYYGGFHDVFSVIEDAINIPDGRLSSFIDQHGLSAFPVELKLNLYEAIANDVAGSKNNAVYLNELNREMGLTQEFYAAQTLEVQQFFAPENKEWIEAKWTQAGNGGTFEDAISRQLTSINGLNDPNAQNLAAFMINAFSEFHGRPQPEVNFINENPNLCGAAGCKTDGTAVINLNMNASSFKNGNFLKVVDTAFHESKHIQQKQLGQKYLAGEIDRSHPDYVAARVFAANLESRAGYLTPDNELGHEAYENQPVEIDARASGRMAAHLVKTMYGRNNIIQADFSRQANPPARRSRVIVLIAA